MLRRVTLKWFGAAMLVVLGVVGCGSASGSDGTTSSGVGATVTAVGATGGGAYRPPIIATEIAVGRAHSCALLDDSTVACWGSGDRGQLGDGMSGKAHARPVPALIEGLTGVTAIRAGVDTTCAIVSPTATLRCWGDGRFGQLGNGQSGEDYFESLPVAVNVEQAVDLAVAGPNACAVFADGSVRCWGRNGPDRPLGFPSPDCGPYRAPAGDMGSTLKPIPCESAPRLVPMLDGAARIASGGSHSCALVKGGGVRCWGADSYGQLGDGMSGSGQHNPVPTAVSGLDAVDAIAVGAAHTCAVLPDRRVRCWGDNSFGQLGLDVATLDSYKTMPTEVPGLVGVVDLHAAIHTSCVTLADKTVQCWGDGNDLFKEPLDAMDGNPLKPTKVPEVAGAVSVRAAGTHACVRAAEGTVACWGRNEHGEIGNGSVGPFAYTLAPVAF